MAQLTPEQRFAEAVALVLPSSILARLPGERGEEADEAVDSVVARDSLVHDADARDWGENTSPEATSDDDANVTAVPERRAARSRALPSAWNATAISAALAAAPRRIHKCCRRDCLDAIERDRPDWVKSARLEIENLRKQERVGNTALRRALGEGGRPIGG